MYRYYQPTEVIFGNGEAEKVGFYLEQKNWKQALMIADPIVEKMGLAKKIIEASQGRIVALTTDVEPNPTLENIQNGIDKGKQYDVQVVIAIGGGSAIDCAKTVAAAIAMDCSPKELFDGKTITTALPVLAIPTTSGTGSEVTAGAVLSDRANEEKKALFGVPLFPKLAIVDPLLTHTCPPTVTASTGMDVLAHALDALTSVKAQPATDALAIQAARLAFGSLEKAVKDGSDLRAREDMSMASVLAGLAFSQTGTTASHACSYILTSKYGMPHGEACVFTLDYWFPFNAIVKNELHDFSREMGFADAHAVGAEILRLKKKFGLKTTLKEAGIDRSEIDHIAESALASANMANNVAPVTKEQVISLFQSLERQEIHP